MIGKILLSASVLLVWSAPLAAQTFNEWFRQKRTQRQYLVQQIAALRVYADFLQNGYDIVRDGTGLIGQITGGEFGLHRDYLGSLEKVRPELLADGKAEATLDLHRAMEGQRAATWSAVSRSRHTSETERRGIRRFLDGLADACAAELEDLMLVTTDGKLELDDHERLKRIDRTYTATRQLYALHRNALPGIASMLQARERDEREIELLRKLFGVAP